MNVLHKIYTTLDGKVHHKEYGPPAKLDIHTPYSDIRQIYKGRSRDATHTVLGVHLGAQRVSPMHDWTDENGTHVACLFANGAIQMVRRDRLFRAS